VRAPEVEAMNAPLKRETALACRRLRKFSATLYALALSAFCLGFAFAFVLPWLQR
jgi:hypothetical protein